MQEFPVELENSSYLCWPSPQAMDMGHMGCESPLPAGKERSSEDPRSCQCSALLYREKRR